MTAITANNYSDSKDSFICPFCFSGRSQLSPTSIGAPSTRLSCKFFFFIPAISALHLHLTYSSTILITKTSALDQRAGRLIIYLYNLVSQYMKINLHSISLVDTQPKSRLYYMLPIPLDMFVEYFGIRRCLTLNNGITKRLLNAIGFLKASSNVTIEIPYRD